MRLVSERAQLVSYRSNIESAEGNSHLPQPPVQDLSFFLLFSGFSKASLEVLLLPLCLLSLRRLSEAPLRSIITIRWLSLEITRLRPCFPLTGNRP